MDYFQSISFRYNKALLIFKGLDDDFVKINREAFELVEELKIDYVNYVMSCITYTVIQKAMTEVSLKYGINELDAIYIKS